MRASRTVLTLAMIFLVSGLVLFAYAAIYKPEDIPTVEPSDYKNFADYILNDDGTIEEVSSGNIYTYTNPSGGHWSTSTMGDGDINFG